MSDSSNTILAAVQALGGDLRAEITGLRTDLTGRITELRTDLSGRIERLEDGQAGLSGRIERLEAGQTSLRVDLMERMDRLQDTLTQTRDDVAVGMGAADTAQRVNENTREDLRSLREQVSVMWRQLKAVEAKVRHLSGDP